MLKHYIKRLASNHFFPVMSSSLFGLKMQLNHLINGYVFFKNYEPDKQAIIKYFVKDGDVFFDIGSNIGLHSFFCVKNIPNIKVVAFEPFKENVVFFKRWFLKTNYIILKCIQ